MWPAPGYSSGNVERYIREQRVVQSSGNGYVSEQRTFESPHSQALSIGPPLQGSNVQQFGPAPTDQRGRYDFNTVGNPGPITPIGHSDQYSSNPLQNFEALTLGGPSDPYGRNLGPSIPGGNYGSAGPNTYGNPGQLTYGQCYDPYGRNLGPSIPGGNYGSAGPSTYGNPGQLTYGQCNDRLSLNPFGNIRSNPGIFTPRGNSASHGRNRGRSKHKGIYASHGRNRGRSKPRRNYRESSSSSSSSSSKSNSSYSSSDSDDSYTDYSVILSF